MVKCFLGGGYASNTSMTGDTPYTAGADDQIRQDALPIPISEEVNVRTRAKTLIALGVIALATAMTFIAANWHIVEAGRRSRFD